MFVSGIRANANDRSPYGNFWFSPVPGRSASGANVTPDSAMQLPVVIACTRVLAESMAVLPLKIYDIGGAYKKLLKKHWLYDLLRKPNPYQNGFEWVEMLQGHLVLRGNAYCQIVANRQGQITALIPLHPDRITVKMIDDQNYRYEYKLRDGTTRVFARGDLWHLRGLSSDGICGLSMIGLARESVGLGLAAQEYGSRFFQNDAKPGGGWLEHPSTFKDKAQRDQFRESFQEAQSGVNRGKTAVLEWGMKYHELGATNKDSQFLEARQFQVTDICRIFRVPPHMAGDLSKATFTNIEQQSLDFVTNTMLAWAKRWEAGTETDLLTDADENIRVGYDFTEMLRGDQVARAEYYTSGINSGWMTRNEARASENMEPLDGLDEPLRPLNMVEESEAENMPATPARIAPDDAPPEEDPPKPKKDARLHALLVGNAQRMARRFAANKPVPADALAEALAIPMPSAVNLLSAVANLNTEPELLAALTAAAKEGT